MTHWSDTWRIAVAIVVLMDSEFSLFISFLKWRHTTLTTGMGAISISQPLMSPCWPSVLTDDFVTFYGSKNWFGNVLSFLLFSLQFVNDQGLPFKGDPSEALKGPFKGEVGAYSQISERGPHPHCYRRRTQRVSWQMVDTLELCGFRHDARKASPWLQRSVGNLASPQESRGWSLLSKLVQSSSSSWWQTQDSWWYPSPETSPRRWTWHWLSVETCENQWMVYVLVEWVSQRIWCKITVIIAVTVNAVHCHRRGC